MKLNERQLLAFKILFVLAVFVFAWWVSGFIRDNQFVNQLVGDYGYFAAFAVAVVSGFNFVVPIPAVSFVPIFAEAGLNIWGIIVVLSAGMTLADFIAYLIGKTGREFISSGLEKRVVVQVERLHTELGWSPALVLFLFASFAPFPNEVMVIPFSFLGYPAWKVLMPVFLGNIVFNSVYSAGIINLFNHI